MMQWAKSFQLLSWPRTYTSSENLTGKREALMSQFCCKSDSIHSIVGLPFVEEIEMKF